MDQLQVEIDQMVLDIEMERARGNFPDADKMAEELARKLAKMDGLRAEQAAADAQKAVEVTANEIASSMEVYLVGDMEFTLEQLAVDADALEILRRGIAENSQKQAQKWLDDLNAQKAIYEQKLTAAQAEITIQDRAIDELQSENAQLQIEKDDLAEKRDAAVKVAEEAAIDAARLEERVAELEKQLVETVSVTQTVEITSSADLEAAAQRLKAKRDAEAQAKREADEASKIAVFNVRNGDHKESFYYAQLANTGEEIEIRPYYELKSKYRVVSDEEAGRFREEYEAANKALVESTPDIEEPVELDPPSVPQFQDSEDAALEEHAVHGESATENAGEASENEVSRAEFEKLKEEVMTRLFDLEVAVHGPDYVKDAA